MQVCRFISIINYICGVSNMNILDNGVIVERTDSIELARELIAWTDLVIQFTPDEIAFLNSQLVEVEDSE